MNDILEQSRDEARELDRRDALSGFREHFWIPQKTDGSEQLYF